jgi:hypothetical protein
MALMALLLSYFYPMNTLSNEQEDALKALVSQFVEVYLGHPDTKPLDENLADDITDDFHVMLMDAFVNPFAEPDDE